MHSAFSPAIRSMCRLLPATLCQSISITPMQYDGHPVHHRQCHHQFKYTIFVMNNGTVFRPLSILRRKYLTRAVNYLSCDRASRIGNAYAGCLRYRARCGSCEDKACADNVRSLLLLSILHRRRNLPDPHDAREYSGHSPHRFRSAQNSSQAKFCPALHWTAPRPASSA